MCVGETQGTCCWVVCSYVDCACTFSKVVFRCKFRITQHGLFCWKGGVESEVCEMRVARCACNMAAPYSWLMHPKYWSACNREMATPDGSDLFPAAVAEIAASCACEDLRVSVSAYPHQPLCTRRALIFQSRQLHYTIAVLVVEEHDSMLSRCFRSQSSYCPSSPHQVPHTMR
jgi:hypothetical protein